MKILNAIILSSLLFICNNVYADTYNISAISGIAGWMYVPSTINAQIGDTINISASISHPLIQVDSSTWQANGTTPLSGGWGTKTTDYTFIITQVEDIYFICQNHATQSITSPMKGVIYVSGTTVGLSKKEPDYQINIFPNPGKNVIYIDSRGSENKERIEIFNIQGKLVFSSQLSRTLLSVKASEIGSVGNYLVKLYDFKNKATETRQLVLQ